MNTTTVNIPVTTTGKDSKGYTVIIDEATISFKAAWEKPEEYREIMDTVKTMLTSRLDKITVNHDAPTDKPPAKNPRLERAKECLQGYWRDTEAPDSVRMNLLEEAIRQLVEDAEQR